MGAARRRVHALSADEHQEQHPLRGTSTFDGRGSTRFRPRRPRRGARRGERGAITRRGWCLAPGSRRAGDEDLDSTWHSVGLEARMFATANAASIVAEACARSSLASADASDPVGAGVPEDAAAVENTRCTIEDGVVGVVRVCARVGHGDAAVAVETSGAVERNVARLLPAAVADGDDGAGGCRRRAWRPSRGAGGGCAAGGHAARSRRRTGSEDLRRARVWRSRSKR